MLNHIVLMGRLVRDPELRRTQSGIAVASFRIAVDRDIADKATGQRSADFIDIVAWRGTAEFVSKYFTKGSMIVVEGRLQVRDWQDKDGNKRYSTEVVANNIYFGESRRSNDGGNYAPRSGNTGYGGNGGYQNGGGNNYGGGYAGGNVPSAYEPSGAPAVSEFAELGDDDGELPF